MSAPARSTPGGASRPPANEATGTLSVCLWVALAASACAAPPPSRAESVARPTGHATTVPGADVVDELVSANHVLADQSVFDAFGHVSVRHPAHPERFLMSRSLAPALVTADDVVELDLDGNATDGRAHELFLERFIHSEIYRLRPDVMAVVHSHSPSVVAIGTTDRPMLAMFHSAAFLAAGVPVFDIRDEFGQTDMLVRDAQIGRALAERLGDKAVVLMRGHGSVATGPTLPLAVFRAVYTELDARLQLQAEGTGGRITALTAEEGRKADGVNAQIVGRAWDLWKRHAAASGR
jgi:ribulose-5-phosphate 4-epimerase/fuculose-1-phosphate aldolase